MTSEEKLDFADRMLKEKPRLAICYERGKPPCPKFGNDLKARFPYVSSDYLRFLSHSDGAQIDMFLLFGSGAALPSLWNEADWWGQAVSMSSAIPVGKDASGDLFTLDREGKVHLIENQEEKTIQVADSFEVFIADVLMGERFLDLFPYGRTDSEWFEFLREVGWYI